MTATKRRLGAESSATRTSLIDAAEQIILNEGYAAITARRIADRAGIKFQLIYYYFKSLDDLLLAVFQRGAEESLNELLSALESKHPLRALWNHCAVTTDNRFVLEFMTLALHHEPIRAAITEHAERLREIQTEAISRHFRAAGAAPPIPPVLASLLIAGMSRAWRLEAALGMTSGHAEMDTAVSALLDLFDQEAPGDP